LKLIEWRWGLAPLTARDASSDVANLAYALNFKEPDNSVPVLPQPQAPLLPAPCLANLGGGILSTGSTTAPPTEWQVLGNQATALGFTVN
jgi:phospholipase C